MDTATLDKMCEGDTPALNECLALVTQWALRRGISREDAEDIAVETAVRAVLRRDQYFARASVYAWLLGIAWNVYREQSRYQARRAPASEPLPDDPPEIPDHDLSLDDALIRQEAIEEALERLPPDQKQAITLTAIDGLPIELAAEQMQREPNAIYNLRSRAFRSIGQYYRTFPW